MNVSLHRPSYISSIAAALLTAFALILTGCSFDTAPIAATVDDSAAIAGIVHGGPNPVANAAVTLYATTSVSPSNPASANNYGYGQPGIVLGTATTNSNGNFTITRNGTTCTVGQQAYVVAAGGNTGSNSTNSNALLMAAIGPCSGVSPSTNVWIDEPSTIAAAYALSGFMTVSGTTVNISAPPNNNATSPSCSQSTGACVSSGLAHAFLNAANLVNSVGTSATGLAYVTLPTNAKGVVPQSTIHALANSVEACINSSGTSSTTSTACTTLFTNTTPPTALGGSGTAPTNTLQALLYLAKFPQPAMASAIFGIGSSIGFYSPALTSAPSDFSLAINYKGSGTTSFGAPWSVATDISDYVYVADGVAYGNNPATFSIFSLSSNGAPNWITPKVNVVNTVTNPVSAASTNDQLDLVTDAAYGFVYAPNDGFVYQLNSSSGAITQTIPAPSALANIYAGALDPYGDLYITGGQTSGSAGLEELAQGTTNATSASWTGVNVGSPAASISVLLRDVYFDKSGNIWAGSGESVFYSNYTGSYQTPVVVPVTTPAGSVGIQGVPMLDTLGNVWVSSDANLYKIANGQSTVAAGAAVVTELLVTPNTGTMRYAAMDGGNNVWVASANSGAGSLWVYYTLAPSANTGYVTLFPCNVGAATSCGPTYTIVNTMRGLAIDSTGSVWAAAEQSPDVVQLLGPGTPTWSQASVSVPGPPY